jgi:hypothetical protein
MARLGCKTRRNNARALKMDRLHEGATIFSGIAFTRGPRPAESSRFALRRNGRLWAKGGRSKSSGGCPLYPLNADEPFRARAELE